MTLFHDLSKQIQQLARIGKIFARWYLAIAITSIIIKLSPCVIYLCYNVFTIKINMFKHKRFKDGSGIYKNTGSSHVKGYCNFILTIFITKLGNVS